MDLTIESYYVMGIMGLFEFRKESLAQFEGWIEFQLK